MVHRPDSGRTKEWDRNVIIYLCCRFGYASAFLENLMPVKIILMHMQTAAAVLLF